MIDLFRRLVCRLRGHLNVTQTLRLGDESRDVRLYCRRCGVTLAQRTDPVLMVLGVHGIQIRCYGTGEVGGCGHPLAECQGGQCGGTFCPACGQWRCASCEGFAAALRKAMDVAAARMDEWVRADG
jgi:hypothetical protein